MTPARTLDQSFGKSPRMSEGKSPRVVRPGKEAPAPPAKEAPAPPKKRLEDGTFVESSPLMGKSRTQVRTSGSDWVDGRASNHVDAKGPHIVKLEQEVSTLRSELDAVKRELARVVALVEHQ